MRRLVVFVCALGWLACSSKGSGARLHVTITLERGLQSACVKLEVIASNRPSEWSTPMATSGKQTLQVAVYQDTLPNEVVLRAFGFHDAACTQRTTPSEHTEDVAASFVPGRVSEVGLTLRQVVDADHDGVPAPADCDDNDPARFPGNPETCRDGTDDDCDGAPDCSDSECDGRQCGPSQVATPGVCLGGSCAETDCGDGLDNDGTSGADCLDSDCNGQRCQLGGTCVGSVCRTGTEICDDRVENDGDGLLDCADLTDCSGQACDDGNPCSIGEVCTAGSCTGGAARVCTTQAACFLPTGVCHPDAGGCVFRALDAGTPCDDGRACTSGDACYPSAGCRGTFDCSRPPSQCLVATGACSASGACVWTERTGSCDDGLSCTSGDTCITGVCVGASQCANPPGPCFSDAGLCTPGGCRYEVTLGSRCDDGDNCTLADACATDGGCVGTPVTCAPPECQAATGCSPQGGCLYTPVDGASCDGGWGLCLGGDCIARPNPVFPFTPTNFTEDQLPPTDGGVVFSPACNVIIETQNDSGGYSLTASCPVIQPPFVVLAPDGGPEVLVLAVDSLNTGVRITARGVRPLILAVKGDAVIGGTVDLAGASAPAAPGAGGGLMPFCAEATVDGGDTLPGAGAAGGAFGLAGGRGGPPAGGGTEASSSPVGEPMLSPLRAGCNGGRGGNAGGLGGLAGGAVQVSVAGTLLVSGVIRAGGSEGLGAPTNSRGGGGGGSGGAILLEAGSLRVTGTLAANGGSGGEGSGGTAGVDGNPATDTASPATAPGGASSCGGNGGRGGALNGSAGAGGAGTTGCTNQGGGGGGGGSVGRIRLRALGTCNIRGALISPAPLAPGC